MLYYLFKYLHELDFPGAGMFDYISFRAALNRGIHIIVTSFCHALRKLYYTKIFDA